MSIVIISRKDISTRTAVKSMLYYIAGNKEWDDMDFTSEYNCFVTYGLTTKAPDVDSYVEMLTDEIMLQHGAYGFSGHRYGYHIMLDFNGEITSPQWTGAVGIAINSWWNQFNLSWVQGVHLTKKKPFHHLCPHVHLFLSTMILAGPYAGKKFCIGKAELENFKIHANTVLREYGIAEIEMKHLLGGKDNE